MHFRCSLMPFPLLPGITNVPQHLQMFQAGRLSSPMSPLQFYSGRACDPHPHSQHTLACFYITLTTFRCTTYTFHFFTQCICCLASPLERKIFEGKNFSLFYLYLPCNWNTLAKGLVKCQYESLGLRAQTSSTPILSFSEARMAIVL